MFFEMDKRHFRTLVSQFCHILLIESFGLGFNFSMVEFIFRVHVSLVILREDLRHATNCKVLKMPSSKKSGSNTALSEKSFVLKL